MPEKNTYIMKIGQRVFVLKVCHNVLFEKYKKLRKKKRKLNKQVPTCFLPDLVQYSETCITDWRYFFIAVGFSLNLYITV